MKGGKTSSAKRRAIPAAAFWSERQLHQPAAASTA
jgi:hypothetical protein